MGFASAYLDRRALFPVMVEEVPDAQTGIIVVVPAYNEPEICCLLNSLALCRKPDCGVEVIIVVNSPSDTLQEVTETNRKTLEDIKSWKKANSSCFFRLFSFYALPVTPGWGVGLARKTGMDEAVRRFDFLNKPEGIILSLDADCLVEKNYLVSVCDELLYRKNRNACSIYFEHPLSGPRYPESIYRCITLYELHLRYYFQGLAYSLFPYVFHTVGSAMAVKALIYVKAGGMNRKQAGEDFYFIQKLVASGGYFNLLSTTVFPSPRISSRVPFGTGASIGKLTSENSSAFLTYNVKAFQELRSLFGMIDKIYSDRGPGFDSCYALLPPGLKSFIEEEEWRNKMIEIRDNTSGLQSLKKRFFGWFNMFKIVKYLNFVHATIFEKVPVDIAASELLEEYGIVFNSKEPAEILMEYRRLERNV